MSKTLTQDDLNQIAKHADEYGEVPEGLIDPLIATARHSLELEAENVRLRDALKSILDLIKGDVVDPDGFVVEEIVRRALEAGR